MNDSVRISAFAHKSRSVIHDLVTSASREIETILVDRFNVHVNAGSMYGEAGEGFIRINLACPRELLDEGLKRITDGLSSVR